MQSANTFVALEHSSCAWSIYEDKSTAYPTPGMTDTPGYFPGYDQAQPTDLSYMPHQTDLCLFQSSAEVPQFDIPYRYWEDEAKTLLLAYDSQALQRVIRYRLFRDGNLPRRALRRRGASTIEKFLLDLVTPQEVALVAQLSHNQRVEEIIRRSEMINLSFIPWSWFPPHGRCDPEAIAAAIDAESQLQFSCIPFEEWVRYSLGYEVISVKWFLQQHTNFFLHLLNHLQGFVNDIQVYLEVEKALRSRSPFAHQAVAQCLLTLLPEGDYDIRVSLNPGFEFIVSPIQRLFRDRPATLAGILKILSVLAIRFRQTYVHVPRMDWSSPFDVDITFMQKLFSTTSADDFARLLTISDKDAFASLSPESVIANDSLTQEYLAAWHKLTSSVWEYCSVLPDQIDFIQKCVQSLFNLYNYHSAMAILLGLQRHSITSSTFGDADNGCAMLTPNPVIPPDFLHLMAPWDNYATYRDQFSVAPGLPFLIPHMNQAIQDGPAAIYRLFEEAGMRRASVA